MQWVGPEAWPQTHSSQLPMVLKVPRLNTSPLALCDRPFSLLGFGDILVPGMELAIELGSSPQIWVPCFGPALTLAALPPGLLVAYCHRFDIQVQSSRLYFVACTVGEPEPEFEQASSLLHPRPSAGCLVQVTLCPAPLPPSFSSFFGYQSQFHRSHMCVCSQILLKNCQSGARSHSTTGKAFCLALG